VDLELQISPIDLYSAIAEHSNIVFLLESAEGNEKLARFSFIGFSPNKHIALKNNLMKIGEQEYDTTEPLQQLKKEVLNTKQKQAGFIGGAVGYFSFEFFKYIENVPLNSTDTLDFPDFEFGIFNDVIVYDHKQNSTNYIYSTENRLNEIKKFVKDASFDSKNFQIYNKKCNFTKEKFCENVDIAKEHIKNGDIFQAVISKRYELKFDGSLVPFYKKLKALNPSPYMYYLKFDEREIIGSSPENLVRVENNDITSYATLAGTRGRGRNIEEDLLLEKELLNDEKERAEHLMLVDLTRNDIGKVARAGTVKVAKLMDVHKYSEVQHIASAINAKLAENKDAFDAFKAIFPAGTVSGAPKIRAIEIIDELEKVARGPYGGAIGYFSSNGNADFAIGIRTLFAEKRKAYIQTGAGIVYDSIPETEFYETEKKAKALLNAIGDEKYELAINR